MTAQPVRAEQVLVSCDTKAEADLWRHRLAARLVARDLAGVHGVAVRPLAGAFVVVVARHDDRPLPQPARRPRPV